jgi:DNA-binding XRE family transcriptional regulator
MNMSDLTKLSWVRQAALNGEARCIRVEAGITQAELASVVGVVQSALNHWESGKRRPTGEAALRYANTLRTLGKRPT